MAKTQKNKYTTQYVPIKDISAGKIMLDNGLQVTGVKVVPKNIFILDKESENATISSLRNVYNVIDYEFWLIVADRPVDINVYLANLQTAYNSSTSTIKRKLIMQDIEKGNTFMSNNVVDTEFFILFKEKSDEVINKRIRMLISTLASAGLTSFQTSNDDLRMILDNFLNGGSATNFGTVLGL